MLNGRQSKAHQVAGFGAENQNVFSGRYATDAALAIGVILNGVSFLFGVPFNTWNDWERYVNSPVKSYINFTKKKQMSFTRNV